MLIQQAMIDQGRTDYYHGANNFVYYSVEQAHEVYREVMEGHGPARAYRGPDAFWVGGVDPNRRRKVWIAWEEGGKLPDVIIELLHPWTAHKDRTEKRDLYERVFGTAEYFLYDPETQELEGLRLAEGTYRPIKPADNGWLWSEQLGVFLGLWHGVVERRDDNWVRLFRTDGSLIPTSAERADAAERRAEEAWQRAEAAEAENARLRALLKERGQG